MAKHAFQSDFLQVQKLVLEQNVLVQLSKTTEGICKAIPISCPSQPWYHTSAKPSPALEAAGGEGNWQLPVSSWQGIKRAAETILMQFQ